VTRFCPAAVYCSPIRCRCEVKMQVVYQTEMGTSAVQLARARESFEVAGQPVEGGGLENSFITPITGSLVGPVPYPLHGAALARRPPQGP
jgi:hypothetical protein